MTEITEAGRVSTSIQNGIGEICFSHPKANSLPGKLLNEISQTVDALGADDSCKVILLKSEGEKAFCAGASFDEFQQIENVEQGIEFFSGFSKVILSMVRAPKFIVVQVQGKAVGGGVGLISAADYSIAVDSASIKLSEYALGFGPFVIGPCVEKRIGLTAFQHASIDTDWRDSAWCHRQGLFTELASSLDEVKSLAGVQLEQLASREAAATAELKEIFWAGTEHWATLLPERAEKSARLMLASRQNN